MGPNVRAASTRPRHLLLAWLLGPLAWSCVPGYQDDAGAGPKDRGIVEDATPLDDASEAGDAAPLPPPDASVPDAAPPDSGPAADGDRDGIPDAEDPDPGVPNPTLLDDTFETTAMGWTFTSVSMGIDTTRGVLEVDVLEPLVREGWIGPRPAWFDVYARTLVRVTRVGTSRDEGSGRAGIITRVNQVSPDRYLLCALDLKLGLVTLTEHDGGGPAGTLLASAPLALAIGELVLLSLEARGSGLTCRAGASEASAASTTYTTGSIGFRAFDATFEAERLEVYGL